jgi:uncharacterized membrane protein YphA (DoxX/SURF4 family)
MNQLIVRIGQTVILPEWLIIILRIVFGVILIAASIDKLIHPLQFARDVENYRLLGTLLSRWVAIWLPYLELTTGILLIAGVWFDAAAIINILLMFVFFLAIIQAYIRGLDINCGCFSVGSGAKVSLSKIAYNLLLLMGSFLLFMAALKEKHFFRKN